MNEEPLQQQHDAPRPEPECCELYSEYCYPCPPQDADTGEREAGN